MEKTPEAAYEELVQRVKNIALLGNTASVLHWDMETYMPSAGAEYRSRQLSLLSGMLHEQFTAPEIGDLLTCVEQSDLVKDPLSDCAVNVREIRREYDREVKVPKSLVEELARVTSLAHVVWREARKNSDFKAFQPTLENVVRLTLEKADAIATGPTRYDTLLDGYEPGMTTDRMKAVFTALGNELNPFVEEILSSGKEPDRTILTRKYPTDRQAVLGQILVGAIGFDLAGGRIDVTTHPFCAQVGLGDVRVTTRYNERDLGDAMFGLLHEAGHGLYDQGTDPAHFGLPRGGFVSLGIHESQSRMWENFVGRSRGFWHFALPIARSVFPEALSDVSLDAFYWAVNDVQRSYIRVEADEATYNLHVLLRFEIEQAIVSGDLAVADIPGAWNEKMQQLLHITPRNDAEGCLQDTHWSGGGFGYFPTYTLGNLYAAQFFEQARADLGDLDTQFRRGDFLPLREWLKEKIHRQGMRYRANELVEKVTGKPLSHEPLMRHLKNKLAPLYGAARETR